MRSLKSISKSSYSSNDKKGTTPPFIIETETIIDSLAQLELYYQSKYEYHLAKATEAKENKERTGLLLLDLDNSIIGDQYSTSVLHSSSNSNGIPELSSQDISSSLGSHVVGAFKEPQAKSKERSSQPVVINREKESLSSVKQMKRWTLDLYKAMSVIESVSRIDSGKVLHQSYLHHLLNQELGLELSIEFVELYLEEAIRRGYLMLNEFDNNCYIAQSQAKVENENRDSTAPQYDVENNRVLEVDNIHSQILSKEQSKQEDTFSDISWNGTRSNRKSYKLPYSDKLKPTLFETIKEYIIQNRPQNFSVDYILDYLYPQSIQSTWNYTEMNKTRVCISNILGRKNYLGRYWHRLKPGLYKPDKKLMY